MFEKLKRKLRNLFFPEIMVGSHGPPPMNRKQKRVQEALARKARNPQRRKQR